VRLLRRERALSIEELAEHSGVSRAMISRIERAETSASAEVLNKLSIGFGLLLPQLLDLGNFAETRLQERSPVSSARGQTVWKDPATGYKRRTLTPRTAEQAMQLSEITFPPKAKVTFENAFGKALVQQQIWMLDGQMEITLGDDTTRLAKGDCMAMTLDAPITFHNPAGKVARYLVAIIQARQ
jgi:transcriptional regulator with XRE-family HTH domain